MPLVDVDDWSESMDVRTTLIARRDWLVVIGTTLLTACRNAREPVGPPKPETVTLAIEGMT